MWVRILETLTDEPNFEWLMIDARYVKVHAHSAGAVGGSEAVGRTRGVNSKVHLVVDAYGMPVRTPVTTGTVSESSKALELIEGVEAAHLLADKSYDSNEIVETALERGMNPVIPPRRNRREQREYDTYLYGLKHLVENGFCKFKEWRGLATRYCKKASSYLAYYHIRASIIWAKSFDDTP